MHCTSHCSTRTYYDLAGKTDTLWASQGYQGVGHKRPVLEETLRQAVYCKNIQPKALPTDLHVLSL